MNIILSENDLQTTSYNSEIKKKIFFNNTSMKASTIKIIKSDYLAILSLIAPAVAIVLFIDFKYFGILRQFFSRGRSAGSGDSTIFLIMAIVVVCIFLPLLIFRINSIYNHFRDGIEVGGKIVYINLWKDRGRVEYEYQINEKKNRTGNAVHRSKFVDSLFEGQEVKIIVSKNNHKKGLIKEMYMDE